MKRRLLILSILMAMFIAVLFTGKPAQATCPYDLCASNWRDCMQWCNGDPTCENYCDQDYATCMCSNCGACPPGGLP